MIAAMTRASRVLAAITVKNAIARMLSTTPRLPAPMATLAAANISTFFGRMAASARLTEADLTGVKSSMTAIHLGGLTDSPDLGRLVHWSIPKSTSSTRMTNFRQDTAPQLA